MFDRRFCFSFPDKTICRRARRTERRSNIALREWRRKRLAVAKQLSPGEASGVSSATQIVSQQRKVPNSELV
jgi:hypothetical protein